MTVQLNLPEDLERSLRADVDSGRHASLEEAILERLSRNEEPDLLAVISMSPDALRRDLEDAWSNRVGAVDGQEVFDRIARKSAAVKEQGK